MHRIEKSQRQLLTAGIKALRSGELSFGGGNDDLSVITHDIDNIVCQKSAVSSVLLNEKVNVCFVDVLHSLVQTGTQARGVKGLFEISKCTQIHSIILILVVVGNEEQSKLAVAPL